MKVKLEDCSKLNLPKTSIKFVNFPDFKCSDKIQEMII